MGVTEKFKSVIIYSPYLDSFGGGERYVLSVASILSKNGYKVDLAWAGDKHYLKKAAAFFSLDLSRVNQINFDFQNSRFAQRYFLTRRYTHSFVLSDGSLPFLFSQKNFLHTQVPFSLHKENIFSKTAKLLLISKIVCNSEFTKNWTQKTYGTNKAMVLYPPVNLDIFRHDSTIKKEQILSVGRFGDTLNNKRQDILIDAFFQLIKVRPNLKLILAGSAKSNSPFVNKLKKKAQGYPIYFYTNPSVDTLQRLYKESKYFWHAAGYKIDEAKNPEATEHFGIVLVEALSSDCVVFAVDKGGAREIIQDGKTGYLYSTIDELVKKTIKMQKLDSNKSKSVSRFSYQSFQARLLSLFSQ